MTELEDVIAILNELLGREQEALVPRLFESTVFVSQLSIDGWEWARRAARANRAATERLAELIIELGGVPAPRRGRLASADLHYQELRTVQPRIEKDLEELIRYYRAAARQLGSHPQAASVIAETLQEHESERAALHLIGPSPEPVAAT